MKIYTKTGDKGTTSLIYGSRVAKNDVRVEAYGTCDEANSVIGLAVSLMNDAQFERKQEIVDALTNVQTILFHVGAELATPEGKTVKWSLSDNHVTTLEKIIDTWDQQLPQLTNFILPGGHPAGASLHTARTIVRRAERIVVGIEHVNPLVLKYLNRLSDFLFVAARFVNHGLKMEEKNLQV